jgi:hypothetical protein
MILVMKKEIDDLKSAQIKQGEEHHNEIHKLERKIE